MIAGQDHRAGFWDVLQAPEVDLPIIDPKNNFKREPEKSVDHLSKERIFPL
jgi:hypothetical protein